MGRRLAECDRTAAQASRYSRYSRISSSFALSIADASPGGSDAGARSPAAVTVIVCVARTLAVVAPDRGAAGRLPSDASAEKAETAPHRW